MDDYKSTILNFSDEEFKKCKNGIFVKHFTKYPDDAFPYAVKEFLERNEFDGVCYVGTQRGKVLFEHVDQDVWEHSVMNMVKYIIFWVSGPEKRVSDDDVREDILYVESIKNKSHPKQLIVNGRISLAGTDEDYKILEKAIETCVAMIKKDDGVI